MTPYGIQMAKIWLMWLKNQIIFEDLPEVYAPSKKWIE